MKYLLIVFALFIAAPTLVELPCAGQTEIVEKKDDKRHFYGTWKTWKNKKLDGDMDCYSVQRGDKWKARFTGVWQGVKFDYTVDFIGTEDKLVGKQTNIDGAIYDWTGKIKDGRFTGSFTSHRYTGLFDLKEK